MKRNSMFMLAYIIFIFISLVVKFFFDYEMWTPIISAITIASCIFAVSDIFHAAATTCLDDANTFMPLLDDAMKRVEQIENTFKANELVVSQCNTAEIPLVGVFSEGPVLLEQTKNELVEIKASVTRKAAIAKVYSYLVDPLTVLGFLSFFCAVTFKTINSFLIPIQDYITVFAFGIILVTQYYSNYSREQHKELENHYMEANDILEDLHKTLEHGYKTLGQVAAKKQS